MFDIDMLATTMADDDVTYRHIRRVQIYAVRLAREIGVSDSQAIEAIEAAALLHDVGKLGVPKHILNKRGKLTPSEFEIMKRHVELGVDILEGLALTASIVPIVRSHHEHWDGTGYPCGLSGSEIPLGARILSVVDSFDAMTSDRPYRPGIPGNAALQSLLEQRGTKYDPVVVDCFTRMCLRSGAAVESMTIH